LTMDFHAIKSVAPLKRFDRFLMIGGFFAFPRDQKRGPIEAMAQNRSCSPCEKFPRDQKRGPIEASRC